MQVVPLAPKQLSTPHQYHPDHEVFVQLDEPLWVPRPTAQDVAAEIISLCVQLDSVLLSRKHQRKELSEDNPDARQKRVTFKKLLASKLASIIKLMEEHLARAGIRSCLEDYLQDSGLSVLFPRVELYLQEPDQLLDQVPTPIMDGYFSHLTQLNSILSMSRQINSELLSPSPHKYIAHELALLYQCLGNIPELSQYRKDIEGHFSAVKSCCSPTSPTNHPPRLTGPLKTWLLKLTQGLVDLVLSLSHELFASHEHVQQVLTAIHNAPS